MNKPLEDFVKKINQDGGTYHRLRLGDGLIMNGDYDMSKYVDYYSLPADLTGQTVLDIATSSGFFAIECAQRGGKVTAIDIWEWTPLIDLIKLLDLDIRYVRESIYDLDASFGRFDLVICGSLLVHLPDPFIAIQKIYQVCKNQAVIATICTSDSENNSRPVCEFIGQKATDGDYWVYWTIGEEALKRMLLAAGFARIENARHFNLVTEPDRIQYSSEHVALSAFVT